jgi:hypothetical protein
MISLYLGSRWHTNESPGVSALGMCLGFYTQTLESEPAVILRDPIRVNDAAPQERRDVNLLWDVGVLRLEFLVTDFKRRVK